ncbi:MAG TPA: outer membrane protein assembly factor BamD [Rhodobiaceae bacterium]|nr:outer membrane protein assembly factor BamD [Rhodobiaceae bacterium]|tara:strand:- start:768 stop:1580 length:813 start_codon:yes stop_codon:yes gene_type:complete
MMWKQFITVCAVCGVLAACGASDPDVAEYIERPVEQIYNEAFEELERGNYINASLQFDEVERQHPYSIWARRAMVMAAYTYYLQNKYDEAILTGRRFLSLYPGNKRAPYIYYLIAMCQYERISDVKRDQLITELAQAALVDVIRRFPDSDYARDAVLKLDLTSDHLAGKEMDVGRYYLKRGHFVAASVRFSNVIRNYPRTSHVPEALHRLTEVYVSLGVDAEAQNAAAVLGYNYPDSSWYRDSYRFLVKNELTPKENPSSWISRALDKVF